MIRSTVLHRVTRFVPLLLLGLLLCPGCSPLRQPVPNELDVSDGAVQYRAAHLDEIAPQKLSAERWIMPQLAAARAALAEQTDDAPLTLGTLALWQDESTTSQPAAHAAVPDRYWREDLFHQAGYELRDLATHGVWRGFKDTYWDAENLVVLTATLGASIAIRGTDVDDTIRAHTRGHRQLGDFDEPIQLLGNPGTHFAAAGVLWLSSMLTKDVEQHELARTLGEALAVNGLSTLVLKGAANTRTPDEERLGWPSGHTSSAFTVAAVLNEHYGPWVGVPSLALAGLVGYQRIDSRVHDLSDVVFGAVLGYVVGTSIASERKAEMPELFGMKVLPYHDPETGASGIALMKSW